MAESQLIESLDSLWFFSNLLISSTSNKNTQTNEEPQKPRTPTVKNNKNESPIAEPEEPQKPRTPIVKNNKNESPIAEPLTPKCSTCGELMEEKPHHLQTLTDTQEMRSPEPTDKEERKRRGTRRSKREMWGEVDLDLEYCGLAVDSADDLGNTSMSRYYQVKLPPLMDLDDTMAMKEHLKSWAYAVACTVR